MLRMCGWCLNPYDEKTPRSPGELERVRQTLSITGPAVQNDIAICDSCFVSVGSATRLNNASSIDVGASNTGPSNFILRALA